MKKSTLAAQWDMQRLRHGIALRCIEALPADQLDARPIPNMRSVRELAVHLFAFPVAATESVLAGQLTMDEKAELSKVTDKASLVAYAKESWRRADAAFGRITDEQLAAMVKAPWGEMPGFLMVNLVPDEFLHHRGQLYAYVRALGAEPPTNWDFEGSLAEFQPRQHA